MINQLMKIMKDYIEIEIKEDHEIKKDLDIYDLDYVEIIMSIEEFYNIDLSDKEVLEVATIKDLMGIIKSKQ